jgi:DNA-binding transcriptional LysR family regulator
VCSPDYLVNAGPILEPADLTQHTLLNLDGAPNVAEDWSWWLERAGVDPAIPLRFLGFDNYALVIQSALDGQGIAVGFGGIIDGLLSGGGLVRALDRAYSSGGGVYMTLPKGVESGPEAASFMRWITDQVTG